MTPVMSKTLTIILVIAVGGAIGAGGAYLLDVGSEHGHAGANPNVDATPSQVVAQAPEPKPLPRLNCREARLLEKDLRAKWEPLWMQCDRLKTYDQQGYRRCSDVECKETCIVAKERQKEMNVATRARVRLCAY